MSALGALLVGLVGALGLFAGAAIWMVSLAQATGRSLVAAPVCAVGGCQARLPAAAWLPLLGFGAARRCPTCGAAQPARRLLFETGVAGYYALAAAWHGDEPGRLLATLVFSIPLLIILLVDAWTRLIHTNILGAGLLAGLAFAAAEGRQAALSSILAATIAAAIFALFFVLAQLLYRNLGVVPFGRGDVYLAAMIGAMVRLDDVIQALFAGILFAGAASLVLLLSRRLGRHQPIPYGPYLCAGALLTLVT